MRIKAISSGFDGINSYAAGDIVPTHRDHAVMTVLLGNAVLLDDNDQEIPRMVAAKLLRASEDEISRWYRPPTTTKEQE